MTKMYDNITIHKPLVAVFVLLLSIHLFLRFYMYLYL